MLNIEKNLAPKSFAKFVKQNSSNNWKDLDVEIKAELTSYILKNEQNIQGESYCVYCEKKINSIKSHIEHINPRDNSPQDTFNYENLVVSCESKDSCGKKKDNAYFDEFISPVTNNPNKYFTYLENGEILSKDTNAQKTCNLLNLNNKKLKQARQSVILSLQTIDDIESVMEYYNDFPTLLESIVNNSLGEFV